MAIPVAAISEDDYISQVQSLYSQARMEVLVALRVGAPLWLHPGSGIQNLLMIQL